MEEAAVAEVLQVVEEAAQQGVAAGLRRDLGGEQQGAARRVALDRPGDEREALLENPTAVYRCPGGEEGPLRGSPGDVLPGIEGGKGQIGAVLLLRVRRRGRHR